MSNISIDNNVAPGVAQMPVSNVKLLFLFPVLTALAIAVALFMAGIDPCSRCTCCSRTRPLTNTIWNVVRALRPPAVHPYDLAPIRYAAASRASEAELINANDSDSGDYVHQWSSVTPGEQAGTSIASSMWSSVQQLALAYAMKTLAVARGALRAMAWDVDADIELLPTPVSTSSHRPVYPSSSYMD